MASSAAWLLVTSGGPTSIRSRASTEPKFVPVFKITTFVSPAHREAFGILSPGRRLR